MEEIILEPQEIKMIPTERTSLIEAPQHGKPKRITEREYRRMLRKLWFTAGVELGVIVVMVLIIYILQAGPI